MTILNISITQTLSSAIKTQLLKIQKPFLLGNTSKLTKEAYLLPTLEVPAWQIKMAGIKMTQEGRRGLGATRDPKGNIQTSFISIPEKYLRLYR